MAVVQVAVVQVAVVLEPINLPNKAISLQPKFVIVKQLLISNFTVDSGDEIVLYILPQSFLEYNFQHISQSVIFQCSSRVCR